VTIFIDADTNIDGTPITQTYVDVVGIGGQFDSTFPYLSGYQIQPRRLADITYLNPLAVGEGLVESGLWLGPASPNPIGRSAEVQYRIPGSSGEAARVRLQVVDLQGRLVATLFDGVQSPGQHRVKLDRQGLAGAAGAVHFLRLEVDGQSVARKLIYR
jgi:hypothetical protein